MKKDTRKYRVTMSDGSKWEVPVAAIIKNREKYYEGISQKIDAPDDHEIEDWAKNNMNWEEVAKGAIRVFVGPGPDYQDGWVNGSVEIID